jgi:hypothetical protein
VDTDARRRSEIFSCRAQEIFSGAVRKFHEIFARSRMRD